MLRKELINRPAGERGQGTVVLGMFRHPVGLEGARMDAGLRGKLVPCKAECALGGLQVGLLGGLGHRGRGVVHIAYQITSLSVANAATRRIPSLSGRMGGFKLRPRKRVCSLRGERHLLPGHRRSARFCPRPRRRCARVHGVHAALHAWVKQSRQALGKFCTDVDVTSCYVGLSTKDCETGP